MKHLSNGLVALFAAVCILATAGCADASPGTTSGIRQQLVDFEEEVLRHTEGTADAGQLWADLAPTTPVVDVKKGGIFPEDTATPMIFDHSETGSTVTMSVFVAASGFAGGGFFSDTSRGFICVSYRVDLSDDTLTRDELECPEGSTLTQAEPVTLEALDLDDLS